MSRIGIVVPNFNGERVLPSCLDAVAAQTSPPADVVVVDNGSTDGSLRLLAERYPWARVVYLPRNLGFAGAANRGVEALLPVCEFVVILNSDAAPEPDWLAELDAVATGSAPEVWGWGSVLIWPDGRVESAGDQYLSEGRAIKLASGWRPEDLPVDPYVVLAAPGAAPMYRRQVFAGLGGFEERFFLYFEDVDLAMRARLQGWRVLMVPTARVSHRMGGSGTRDAAQRYAARNSVWCAIRTLPACSPSMLVRITGRELRWARRRGTLGPYALGRMASLGGLAWAWRTRRAIQASRTATAAEVLAALEPPPFATATSSP